MTVLSLLVFVNAKAQVKLPERDTVKVMLLVTDTGSFNRNAYYMFAYSVRERHNTSEGVFDAGMSYCMDEHGQRIDCYSDYMKHLYFIDDLYQPLHAFLIIWDSKQRK